MRLYRSIYILYIISTTSTIVTHLRKKTSYYSLGFHRNSLLLIYLSITYVHNYVYIAIKFLHLLKLTYTSACMLKLLHLPVPLTSTLHAKRAYSHDHNMESRIHSQSYPKTVQNESATYNIQPRRLFYSCISHLGERDHALSHGSIISQPNTWKDRLAPE